MSPGESGMEQARLRINLAAREVEIEGSETFVGHWAERVEELLLLTGSPEAAREVVGEPVSEPSSEPAQASLPVSREAAREPFGQFVQRLPNAATEVDRMLAAGLWIQHGSPDDAFATGEASRLLTEHGFKIGNPSQAVRQSLMAKRLFMVQKGRYRVSQQGRQHLTRLGAPLLA